MTDATPQPDDLDREGLIVFSGVFVTFTVALVAYALVVPMPHGPLPLLAALLVFCFYESPIVPKYKKALREL